MLQYTVCQFEMHFIREKLIDFMLQIVKPIEVEFQKLLDFIGVEEESSNKFITGLSNMVSRWLYIIIFINLLTKIDI